MSEWITADIHFGHVNIITYCNRPFATVHEMNEGIIERWNTQVQPGDLVWILGDMCMGQLADTIPLVGRLNGTKILCPGNHDPIWSGAPQKRQDRWRDEFTAQFVAIHPETFIGSIGRGPYMAVQVSHFPYVADDGRDFDNWRPVDEGNWLLHGHVHDHWLQRGRQINVGFDAWGGRLADHDDILDLINMGPSDLQAIPWS